MATVKMYTSAYCPYCSRAKALLEKNPNPSEHEIRWWLAGNLCRCTGYDKIIRAVQQAAQRG